MVKEIIYPIASTLLLITIVKIFSIIGQKIKNTKQQLAKYPKIEKNAVLLAPFPIVKSPKGYIYYPENKKILYCGKCYASPSNMTPLEKAGFKKYICPACKTVYKV
jgi:hypothetical protein